MFNLPKKIKSGFTLIELLVVISVIAILAVIVLYGLNIAQTRARDVQRAAIMRAIQNALQSSYTDKGSYPTSAGTWTANLFPTLTGGVACSAPAGVLCTYISAALKDPGCGQASQQVDIRANILPCTTGVTYAYAAVGDGTNCPAATYQLTLTKEGGGSQYFCGPQ